MNAVKLYTDGAARGNPDGPGGYAAILQYVDQNGVLHEKEISQGFLRTTNNRMELRGVIAGLEALNRPCLVDIYSDSKYITDAFNQGWIENWAARNWVRERTGPVKNADLWKRLLFALKDHKVHFIWVKGHDGNEINERCDKLAVKAALGMNLIEDEGLEQ